VVIGGTEFTKLTFYAGLAAVKPGEFDAEVTLDATMVVREKSSEGDPLSAVRKRMRSLFDDPFFGGADPFDDFFGRLVEKELKLATDPVKITVAEAPQDGRPDGFSGAVGRFTASASTTATEVEAGEPVTVEIQVEGEGNFDRVGAPVLTSSPGWRTYPPSSEFVPGDSIGKAGVKIFKQVVVPEAPGATEVPPFELAYFDPEAESYQVARTGPIPIKVTGDPLPVAAPVAVDVEGPAEPGPRGAGDEPSPAPSAEPATLPAPPAPLYGRTWFQAVAGSALAAAAVAAIALAFCCRRDDPVRAAKRVYQREIEASVAGMDRAAAESDAPAFFASLRKGVQAVAGREGGVAPAAVTTADVRDPELRDLLAAADAVLFAGRPVPGSELEAWRTRAAAKLGLAG
jgi:hypothetical protein